MIKHLVTTFLAHRSTPPSNRSNSYKLSSPIPPPSHSHHTPSSPRTPTGAYFHKSSYNSTQTSALSPPDPTPSVDSTSPESAHLPLGRTKSHQDSPGPMSKTLDLQKLRAQCTLALTSVIECLESAIVALNNCSASKLVQYALTIKSINTVC
jgi:hypothetical protein